MARPPVTLARLEIYLDWLGGVMVDNSPEFNNLMPIYERLEREISTRQQSIDKMTLIKERVRRSRVQMATPIS